MEILVAQKLLALFVVWHKHANALNLPDMLAPNGLLPFYTAQGANAHYPRLNLAPMRGIKMRRLKPLLKMLNYCNSLKLLSNLVMMIKL